ncbi:MAG: DUF4854 domain-containing protein [Cystobacterineae bacterium]|nr:DUF4854 domain-containing protein [Cystobacterineae bacterium]
MKYTHSDEVRIEEFVSQSKGSIAESMNIFVDDTMELEVSSQNKSVVIAYKYKNAEDIGSILDITQRIEAQAPVAQALVNDLKQNGMKAPQLSVQYLNPEGNLVYGRVFKPKDSP